LTPAGPIFETYKISVMIIRKSAISDIPLLVSFQQALAQESEGVKLDGDTLEKGLLAMFDDPSKGFYNLVEDEGQTIGCHMITLEWSDWRNGVVWWLQSVYVVEAYRGKGVFRFMYENVLKSIRQDPRIVGLRLYVDKSNTRAMKVYEAMGMNGDHYTVFEWMKA